MDASISVARRCASRFAAPPRRPPDGAPPGDTRAPRGNPRGASNVSTCREHGALWNQCVRFCRDGTAKAGLAEIRCECLASLLTGTFDFFSAKGRTMKKTLASIIAAAFALASVSAFAQASAPAADTSAAAPAPAKKDHNKPKHQLKRHGSARARRRPKPHRPPARTTQARRTKKRVAAAGTAGRQSRDPHVHACGVLFFRPRVHRPAAARIASTTVRMRRQCEPSQNTRRHTSHAAKRRCRSRTPAGTRGAAAAASSGCSGALQRRHSRNGRMCGARSSRSNSSRSWSAGCSACR